MLPTTNRARNGGTKTNAQGVVNVRGRPVCDECTYAPDGIIAAVGEVCDVCRALVVADEPGFEGGWRLADGLDAMRAAVEEP